MKVLYISSASGADYQCDLIMHGLRSLLGPDLVDVQKMWFMYDTSEHYMFHSLYKLLPDIEVDRGDVEAKIESRYFDAVVYGSVHRCRDHLDRVRVVYPRERIAFVDGEDGPGLAGTVGQGWYFKRELYEAQDGVLPIQFGIPREKLMSVKGMGETRSQLMAHCDPRDRSTYVYYDSEQNYYRQYARAFFGYTMKKGGWDCMRHYEIMANATIPYFADIESCPPLTLALLPRDKLLLARIMYDTWPNLQSEWLGLSSQFFNILSTQLTTEALARRILEHLS
jgi:hypothetical protein